MIPVIAFTKNGTQPEEYDLFESRNLRIGILPLGSAFSFPGDAAVELAIIYCGNETETGLSLLAEIKRQRPDVPVVFVTDACSEGLVLKAFKLGTREYFRPPFSHRDLVATVEKILRFKRLAPDEEPSLQFETKLTSLAGLPERLQRVIDHIERNVTSPICLEELARCACMSKFHFCRLFRRHVGMSPKQFCISRKIELARQLLHRPDQAVTLTAFRLGFNDVTEFIRQFKKFTGLTPRAFRNSRIGITCSK
jgi:AraC-like DNA-binding protein